MKLMITRKWRLLSVMVFTFVILGVAGWSHANRDAASDEPEMSPDPADGAISALGDVVGQNSPTLSDMRDIVFIDGYMYQLQEGGDIYRINIDTGETLSTITLDHSAMGGLAWDGNYFWTDDNVNDLLRKVDPATGNTISSISITNGDSVGLAWDGRYLWSLDDTDNAIYKIDPDDGSRLDTLPIQTGQQERGMAFDGRYFWIGDMINRRLLAYDPDSGSQVASFGPTAGNRVIGVGFDGTYLWGAVKAIDDSMTNYRFDIELAECLSSDECFDDEVCTDDVCGGGGDKEDTVSIIGTFYEGSTRTQGNIFEVTQDTLFTGAASWGALISPTGSAEVILTLYEGTAADGEFQLVLALPGTFYYSGGIKWREITGANYMMKSGMFYVVAFTWDTPTIQYTGAGTTNADPVSFGLRVGDVNFASFFVDSFTGDGTDTMGYRHKIFTTAYDRCSNVNNTIECNDGVFCNGDDTCGEGTCSVHAGDPCPDDGLWCNGEESCDEDNSQCVWLNVPDCSDSVDCTDDTCDEVGDQCVNTVNDANCDDGAWCNGFETCDAINDCQAGTAPDCDDGVDCTDDSCDEVGDQCANVANDANCDDGLFCNGPETCDEVNDCQVASPVDCDDGIDCTDDSCDEVGDQCTNVADDTKCDDGVFCNGPETCDEVSDCQAGTLVDCDDGVDCTDDSCDEVGDQCVNTASDANCDDGLFCNGVETCDLSNDCQTGMVPCDPELETCNEFHDECEAIVDEDCIVCETTAECYASFGEGWGCVLGCCEETSPGDDDADDDDAINDDVDGIDGGDDDDDDNGACCG